MRAYLTSAPAPVNVRGSTLDQTALSCNVQSTTNGSVAGDRTLTVPSTVTSLLTVPTSAAYVLPARTKHPVKGTGQWSIRSELPQGHGCIVTKVFLIRKCIFLHRCRNIEKPTLNLYFYTDYLRMRMNTRQADTDSIESILQENGGTLAARRGFFIFR